MLWYYRGLAYHNQVELLKKKKFIKAALDTNFETFVIYMAILGNPIAILIYFSRVSQVQDNPTLAILQ